MSENKRRLVKRLIAISLASMITVGGVPASVVGDFGFDTGIVAHADGYSSETIATASGDENMIYFSGDHFTVSAPDGTYVDQTGVRGKNGITVSAKNSETITKVVISCGFDAESVNNDNVTATAGSCTVNNGTVTGNNVNSSSLTFTCSSIGQFNSFTIYYEGGSVAVTGVTLNKTSATLAVGGTDTLTATVAPDGATDKNVTWSSDNTSVATVNANGVVTAVGAGTASITATTTDGGKTASCAVTVNAVSIADAAITCADEQFYTGSAIEPEITVTVDGQTLVKGTDYTVVCDAENTEIGDTATVTVRGIGNYTGEKAATFEIVAALDTTGVSDANIVVYKDKTTVADKIDGKDALKENYYIISDKQLAFEDDDIDAQEYKPYVASHPFKNKDNGDKYCYRVLALFDNVTAKHTHIYKVQTADDKLNVKCEGEAGGYKTIAELTIAEGNYEYGDKVDIAAKKYAVAEYDIADTDVTFGSIYFKNQNNPSISTTSVPTALGSYSAEIAATFSKDNTRYSLYKEFEIGKKDIAKLVKDSVPTAEKNDHIEISLKVAEGGSVAGKTVTYNGREYTPVIKLVNYVYDYAQGAYVESVLVEGTDYTATITPQTNAGHYTVTITAKDDSVNYKGAGSFDWDITKRDFKELSVTDNRTAEQKVYDGEAVLNDEFTVSGLGTDANPGTASGNTLTYKWYKLSGGAFVAMAQDEKPTNAGDYRVEITVSNPNYNNTTVTADFEITKKTVTITPKADNNITYTAVSPAFNTLTFDAAGFVGTDSVTSEALGLSIDGVSAGTIPDAGEYNYVMANATVASLPNYKFELADGAKFVVAKKALTKEMFTVDPTKLSYNGAEQAVNVTASDKVEVALPILDLYELSVPVEQECLKTSDWKIVSGNKATNAGEYTVNVKATNNGNYTGELALDNDGQKWTIEGKDINSGSDDDPENAMTVDAPAKTYTGRDITETVTVKDGEKTLTLGTDYEIVTEKAGDKYVDAQSLTQKNAGTYTFYVVGKGNYSGDRKQTWKIDPAEIVSAKVTGGTKIYDGTAVTDKDFRTTIKLLADDKAKDLTKTFVYKSGDTPVDPTNAGTYTVELTVSDPNNNYKAKTVTATFEIKPREVEVYPAEGQTFAYGATKADIEAGINDLANIELEQAEEDTVTGIIAADNTDEVKTAMFSDKPFTIAGAGDGIVSVDYYDVVTKPDMDVVGNYKLVYNYPVQVEVIKATLKEEWFTLYVRDEDTDVSSAVEYSDDSVTFNGKKIIVMANNGQQLVEGTDYTVNGTTEVYLPGTYSIDIKVKGNYTGKVTKTYKVDPNRDVAAETVVPEATLNDVSSRDEYTYDGESPAVAVVPYDGSAPLPELSKVTYQYWQKNAQGEWEAMAVAPVDAGDYKVRGEVTAKGYEIDVDAAQFTITQKEIQISVDPEDLKGVYGQERFTVPYTYDTALIADRDKDTVAVTGDIVVNVGGGNAGECALDFGEVTINSSNYVLVFPNEDIIAVMTGYIRGGKEHTVSEKGYRFYSFVWLHTISIRIGLKKAKIKLKRIIKKIVKR